MKGVSATYRQTGPWKGLVVCVLLLFWNAALAWMMLKIGGRNIFPDFFRPFIVTLCLFMAVFFFNNFGGKISNFVALACSLLLAFLTYAIILFFRFYKKQHRVVSFDDIYALLQSDSAETVSYFTEYLFSLKSTSLCLSGTVCTLALVVFGAKMIGKLGANRRRHRPRTLLVGMAMLCASFGLATQVYPVKLLIRGYHQYYADIRDFQTVMQQVAVGPKTDAVKKETGELYLLVIGESESRDFMSAYSGPGAQNTPWLETLKGDASWFIFSNAYSANTHTAPVLTAALTDGRHLTGLTFPRGITLLQSLKDAGFSTYWLSNQAALGPWDNPVAALAHQADILEFTNKSRQSFNLAGPSPDECLLPLVREAIRQSDPAGNTFIIIHLMGNHAPYEARYPDGFPRIASVAKGEVGKRFDGQKHVRNFEEYLTSVAYTDSVLKLLHAMVKDEQRPVVFLYFADHGEDVFSIDGGHDIGSFTWQKARIPMFLWLSDAYRKRYPARSNTLRGHVDDIFTNDLIFDLCLGLSNIESGAVNSRYDISNDEYSVSIDNAVITGQRMIHDDPLLHTQRNAGSDIGKKFALHRANTVFKANHGLRLGISGLEVDLLFAELDGKTHLWIGHEEESITGMSLREYLDNLVRMPEFLWLDIKNMTAGNAEGIRRELAELDSRFALREIALVESSHARELEAFTGEGWRVSYYLPWQAIRKAAQSGNDELLQRVAEQVKQYDIPAISFDLAAEREIRERLLPLLPQTTMLYGWTSNLSWGEQKFYERIPLYTQYEKILVPLETAYDY
ncbi:MAG: phosphoethanolamine transferase [Deltaproteobacteria bacterium]|jgi:heptose-I-phosphate ethanolaminephosphotransferase|nr:phosphoethanolamine transferase [Deltaproteobacteria bacterium]